ncbi:MAG: hypothetical protein ACTSRA_00395 [Promethearchaeota archaeon]|nr:MAG: hypothetical protein [Helarchaeota virus Nidhogg Meg22_1012]URC17414.1 MAG: hypothetical protein [Helarchaeota virus Nidhogg Meg22_1214]
MINPLNVVSIPLNFTSIKDFHPIFELYMSGSGVSRLWVSNENVEGNIIIEREIDGITRLKMDLFNLSESKLNTGLLLVNESERWYLTIKLGFESDVSRHISSVGDFWIDYVYINKLEDGTIHLHIKGTGYLDKYLSDVTIDNPIYLGVITTNSFITLLGGILSVFNYPRVKKYSIELLSVPPKKSDEALRWNGSDVPEMTIHVGSVKADKTGVEISNVIPILGESLIDLITKFMVNNGLNDGVHYSIINRNIFISDKIYELSLSGKVNIGNYDIININRKNISGTYYYELTLNGKPEIFPGKSVIFRSKNLIESEFSLNELNRGQKDILNLSKKEMIVISASHEFRAKEGFLTKVVLVDNSLKSNDLKKILMHSLSPSARVSFNIRQHVNRKSEINKNPSSYAQIANVGQNVCELKVPNQKNIIPPQKLKRLTNYSNVLNVTRLYPFMGTKFGMSAPLGIDDWVVYDKLDGENPIILGCIKNETQTLPFGVTESDLLSKIILYYGNNLIMMDEQEITLKVGVRTFKLTATGVSVS